LGEKKRANPITVGFTQSPTKGSKPINSIVTSGMLWIRLWVVINSPWGNFRFMHMRSKPLWLSYSLVIMVKMAV